VQLTHTISVVEVVWTIFCGLGLYFNVSLFWRASIDLAALRLNKINHIREHAAVTHVLSFAGMSFVQFVMLLIGLMAMTIPDNPVSKFRYAVATIFIIVSFVLALLGWVQESRRRHLLRMIADDVEGAGA